jgi:hypothetical protein
MLFFKSKKSVRVRLPESMFVSISSRSEARAMVVDLPLLKPNWLSVRKSDSSRNSFIWSFITCSIILPGMGRREIGLRSLQVLGVLIFWDGGDCRDLPFVGENPVAYYQVA